MSVAQVFSLSDLNNSRHYHLKNNRSSSKCQTENKKYFTTLEAKPQEQPTNQTNPKKPKPTMLI